jgi:hypothetical protein
MRKTLAGFATAAVVAGGLVLAGLGLASGTAQAEPSPFPAYHWCPGDFWDPGWGFNWDGGFCHDDHHRDIDADDHSRDWWGDRDHGGDWDHHGDWDHGGDRGGPAPWQPWWPH